MFNLTVGNWWQEAHRRRVTIRPSGWNCDPKTQFRWIGPGLGLNHRLRSLDFLEEVGMDKGEVISPFLTLLLRYRPMEGQREAIMRVVDMLAAPAMRTIPRLRRLPRDSNGGRGSPADSLRGLREPASVDRGIRCQHHQYLCPSWRQDRISEVLTGFCFARSRRSSAQSTAMSLRASVSLAESDRWTAAPSFLSWPVMSKPSLLS